MTLISVAPAVFEAHPHFVRGLVVASKVDNRTLDPTLASLLTETCDGAAANPLAIKSDPRITAWDEAHRRFGSNPNKFPPAHKALLKRVSKAGNYVPPINAVIAIMNICSIGGVLPVGGDDRDSMGTRLMLKPADGSESFAPLGQEDILEHPEPGEIVYCDADSGQLMCRRWNWRNAHSTRITEHTRSLVMNIDGIGENAHARVVDVRDRVSDLLAEFTGATTHTDLLDIDHPSTSID